MKFVIDVQVECDSIEEVELLRDAIWEVTQKPEFAHLRNVDTGLCDA